MICHITYSLTCLILVYIPDHNTGWMALWVTIAMLIALGCVIYAWWQRRLYLDTLDHNSSLMRQIEMLRDMLPQVRNSDEGYDMEVDDDVEADGKSATGEETESYDSGEPHFEEISMSEDDPPAPPGFLMRINKIIADNLTLADFSVETIVKEMCMSRSVFYQRFKDETGQSIGNYINNYKLNEAKRLLADRHLTINEVAEALGFNSQRYFSFFFKERAGITPTTYRRSVLEGDKPKIDNQAKTS